MALWASTYACEGYVSYTWVDKGMYTAGEPIGYDLDFNGESIIDLLLISTGMWFDVDPPDDNRVMAGGNGVRALSEGYEIGPSVAPDEWQQGIFGLTLNSSATVPPGDVISTGEFLETTAFMGVQFYIDELVHYGWVRISNPFPVTGGIIMDFAYETEAGVGIIAGAGVIPEPVTASLISTGLLVLIIGNRKRKSRTSGSSVPATRCRVR